MLFTSMWWLFLLDLSGVVRLGVQLLGRCDRPPFRCGLKLLFLPALFHLGRGSCGSTPASLSAQQPIAQGYESNNPGKP